MPFEEIILGFNILNLHKPASDEPVIATGQPARISGCEGLFYVVDVDAENHTADLISARGISPVLRDVPFAAMRAIDLLSGRWADSDLPYSC